MRGIATWATRSSSPGESSENRGTPPSSSTIACRAPLSIPSSIIARSADLAARAPICRARVVSLCTRPKPRAAPRARLAGPPVDPLRLTPGLDRVEHQHTGGVEHRAELLVREGLETKGGVDSGLPAALGLEDVPDARDEALIEERLTQLGPRISRSHPGDRLRRIEVRGEDVRAQPPEARIAQEPPAPPDPHEGPAEVDRLGILRRQRDPGLGSGAAPALPGPVDVPAAVHAQMTVQRELVLEVQEQMLAPALHLLEHEAVDRRLRETLRAAAAGSANRDPAAGESAVDPPRHPQDRVALGHDYATRRRGWRRKPASIRAASMPEPITGSPSTRSTASFSICPAWAASASAPRHSMNSLSGIF